MGKPLSISVCWFFSSFINLFFKREPDKPEFLYLLSHDDTHHVNELTVMFKCEETELPTQLNTRNVYVDAYNEYKIVEYAEKHGWGKLKVVSQSVLDYILPSQEGDEEKIEFRSPERGGKLTVVSSNEKSKERGGEYRLTACRDGTVKWLHWLECENNTNHVWTVRWFDKKDGRMVYFGDRLQPHCVKNVNNYFGKTYIGGNVNGSGKQNIGTVDGH